MAEPQWQDRVVRRRDLRLTCAGLADIAATHGVTVVNPLLGAGFLAALTGPARPAGARPGIC